MKRLIIVGLVLLTGVSLFAQEKYPGVAIIGKGYNLFGLFSNNKSVMQYNIFDFSKMRKKEDPTGYVLPYSVNLQEISEHIVQTIEGKNKKEYIQNLSQNIGLSGNAFFFKASVENHLGSNSSQTLSQFYYTYMDINTKWKLSLDTRNIDTLVAYLDPQFKSDLENMAPEELFESYGSHFITTAYLGGRIDYSTATTLSESSNTEDIKLAINAKYGSISGHVESSGSMNYESTLSKTTKNLLVVGGSSEYMTGISNAEQYNAWAKSVGENPVLCGFDKRSLMPIWMLTKNEARRNSLIEYFNNTVLAKYPLPIYFERDEILDNENVVEEFTFTLTGFQVHADCDPWTVLDGDSEGEFMYQAKVYVNDKVVGSVSTPDGFIVNGNTGEFVKLLKHINFDVPMAATTKVKIEIKIIEDETYDSDDLVGHKTYLFEFPFVPGSYETKSTDFYQNSYCYLTVYYQIEPSKSDVTAMEFGNKGWEYFELEDYEQCLKYSREALSIDNSLWYVHYNVALVYLIQKNPFAFEKYKFITGICNDPVTIKSAYQDILNYEAKFGQLQSSEQVKLLLKTNF